MSRGPAQRRGLAAAIAAPGKILLHRGAADATLGDLAGHRARLNEIVSLRREDTLWAVVARLGRKTRVAEVFPNRLAAQADRSWREQQVSAYAGFLRSARQPLPNYTVEPIRRADLPRGWQPLPALGFLRGRIF